jgi:hypothetical protein
LKKTSAYADAATVPIEIHSDSGRWPAAEASPSHHPSATAMPAAARIRRERGEMRASPGGHEVVVVLRICTPTSERPKPASRMPSGITCIVPGHTAKGRSTMAGDGSVVMG